MCANIISDLKNSKNGLNNLKETYTLDIKFVCDLDTLLQTIDAKLDGEEITITALPPPPSFTSA
jgi:hypothetical protein